MKKILNILAICLLSICLFSCDNNPIKNKIKEMSLEEKVTQIIMPSFRFETYEKVIEKDANGNDKEVVNSKTLTVLNDKTKQFLTKHQFGGIILFSQNFESSKQTVKLINDIYDTNKDIPYFISIDQEGGSIKRLSFGTGMPGNMALCASNDPENAYISSQIIGDELARLGINLNFSPVVDLNSNPNNPIIGIRSFSDNPEYCKTYIERSIDGYHDKNIAVSLKHFPGHGDTDVDSHTGLPLVNKTLEEIKDFELKTFKYGIDKDADMIMSAHIQFPNIDDTKYLGINGNEIYLPATLSKTILNILRNELGFNGIICSDSLVMDAIKDNYRKEDIVKLGLEAGLNILLMPVDYQQNIDTYLEELEAFINMTVKMFENKELDIKLLDDSVEKILRLKEKRQIENKHIDDEGIEAYIGSKTSHDIEIEIAKKAITKVEDNGILPLKKEDQTIAIVTYGTQIGSFEFVKQVYNDGNISDDLEVYCPLNEGLETFDMNNLNVDNVIIVSTMYGIEDVNDDYSLFIDDVLKYCKEINVNTILISSNLPYDLSRFDTDVKVASYFGSGIRNIPTNFNEDVTSYPPNIPAAILKLYDNNEFTGKLPVDILEMIQENNEYIFGNNIKYSRGTGLK